jgi:hypothetical protein
MFLVAYSYVLETLVKEFELTCAKTLIVSSDRGWDKLLGAKHDDDDGTCRNNQTLCRLGWHLASSLKAREWGPALISRHLSATRLKFEQVVKQECSQLP